jgi:hypothetical protein
MTRRFTAVCTAFVLVFLSLVPAQAAPKPKHCPAGLAIPIEAASLDQGSFTGVLEITRFARDGEGIVALGTLTGTLTDENGALTGIVRTVSLPVPLPAPEAARAGDIVIQQTCDILHLTLGPLHLDLLGLIIDLNQVNLDITADPTGGLLGSLLCAVANLLNGGVLGGLLDQLVDLLNQILAVLG